MRFVSRHAFLAALFFVMILIPAFKPAAAFSRVSSITIPYYAPFWAGVDPAGQYAYFATGQHIVRIRLSDFTVMDSSGYTESFSSAAIDASGQYMYLGTNAIPGRVLKIRLSDFAMVGDITLKTGEDYLRSAVIDPSGQFAYFGTPHGTYYGTYYDGSNIIKIRLSNFTRVGAIVLQSGEGAELALVDPSGQFAYFGAGATVVKIQLSDFTRVTALAIPSEDGWDISSAVMQPDGQYAYFATNTGKVVKIRLANFTRVGSVTLQDYTTYWPPRAGVIDPNGKYAYFATSGSIVKIRLSDFAHVNTLILPEGSASCAVIDPNGQHAYFGIYSKVVKIALYALGFEFSLSNSGGISVTQGSSGSNTITVTLDSGPTEPVTLFASGLPSGASASFYPPSGSPPFISTCTVSASLSTPAGTYSIAVSGIGGEFRGYTSFTLTVNAAITIASNPSGPGFVRVDGVVITTPKSFNWTFGSAHTLEALSPVSGGSGIQYVWTSWSDYGSQTHTYTTRSSSQTVTANYKTQYYLAVSSNPTGIDNPRPSGWYDSGTTVTILCDTPVSGASGVQYIFTAWSGNASGTYRSTTVTMNGPKAATANYKTQYQLTIQVSPLGGGSTSPSIGSYWYDAGASVTISATPAAGRLFRSWIGVGAGNYTGTLNPATILMNGPISETAIFATLTTFSISTTTSTTVTTNSSIGLSTYQRSTTTTTSANASTSYQTTTTTWYSGSISTTYTTRTTSYSTSTSFLTSTLTSAGTYTSVTTQLSRTGTTTVIQTSSSIVTSGNTVYVNINVKTTFIEQFLQRIISTMTSWINELTRITQSLFITETVRDTVVKVEPPFNFSLSNSGGIIVAQGSSGFNTIMVASNGTSQIVRLRASVPSALAYNVVVSFNPASGNPPFSSTCTITTSPSTPAGSYAITVIGTDGGLTRTTTFTLTVNPSAQLTWICPVAKPGGTGKVKVAMSAHVGVGSAQVVLVVPSELTVGSATLSGFMTGATHLASGTEHRWVQLQASGQQVGSLEVSLTVPRNAAYGTNYTITLKSVDLKDASGAIIAVLPQPPLTGKVQVLKVTMSMIFELLDDFFANRGSRWLDGRIPTVWDIFAFLDAYFS